MARRTKKRRAPARPTAHPKLGSLTNDWYWEQDAAHRLIRIELRAGAGCDDAFARSALGKRRWELGIEIEGGWDAHRALLKSRTPFRDVLTWRTRADGTLREQLFIHTEAGAGNTQCADRAGDQVCRWEYPRINDYTSHGCIKMSPSAILALTRDYHRFFHAGTRYSTSRVRLIVR